MAPAFSIVVIARNEAPTLPRLLRSLGHFLERGGDVLVVDTGSSDDTLQVARTFGCRGHDAGNRFESHLSPEQVAEITRRFGSDEDGPLVAPGERVFHFAAARQYAGGLAASHFVLQLDGGDEALALDVDSFDDPITSGRAGAFEYEQLYGTIRLRIARFYDTRLYHWEGRVHEALFATADAAAMIRCDATQLQVRHHKDERKARNYLAGLALQTMEGPQRPRWSHYLGRELYYGRRHRSAITVLEAHAARDDAWRAERSQSLCFVGECFEALGSVREAEAAYRRASVMDPARREPLVRLAALHCRWSEFEAAAACATEALAIDRTSAYPELDANYTWIPHSLLYWSLFWLGRRSEAEEHWQTCRRLAADDAGVLDHARLFPSARAMPPETARVGAGRS